MKTQLVYEKLIPKIDASKIFIQEPMYKHTTFKIGGEADLFLKLDTIEEIQDVLLIAKKEDIPITIIGNGSNLLVQDKGIRGIVIKPNIKKIEMQQSADKVLVTIGAGVPLPQIARKVAGLRIYRNGICSRNSR